MPREPVDVLSIWRKRRKCPDISESKLLLVTQPRRDRWRTRSWLAHQEHRDRRERGGSGENGLLLMVSTFIQPRVLGEATAV